MLRLAGKFFLIFLLLAPFSVRAAGSDIYMISGVLVNVSGKSPASAKSSARANARRDAFVILLTRLELKGNIANMVSDEEVEEMVRSEQIESEKISGNDYSATFNIEFAKDFVDYILAKKTAPESENAQNKKEVSLLIPVVMKKHQPLLWGEENEWQKSIAKTLQKKFSDKFVLLDSDVSNIASINEKNIANLDYALIEPLIARHKASDAYTLTFSYDEIENKVLVAVVSIGKFQKKQVKLSFVNVNRLGYEDLMNKVADKSIDYLVKAQSDSTKVTKSDLITIKVFAKNLNAWLAAKNKIEKSNLINQLNIESVSRDYVMITVRYVGSGDVMDSFANKGLKLTQESENHFTTDAN